MEFFFCFSLVEGGRGGGAGAYLCSVDAVTFVCYLDLSQLFSSLLFFLAGFLSRFAVYCFIFNWAIFFWMVLLAGELSRQRTAKCCLCLLFLYTFAGGRSSLLLFFS